MSRLAAVSACAALVFLGYVLLSVCDSPSIGEGTLHTPSWDFRKIEKGLLALRDSSREDAPSLLRALQVRAKNTRPDILHNPSSPQMLLEIKGSSETKAVASGEKLFLHWEPSHAGGKARNGPPAPLNWSTEKSCLTLTPFVFPAAQDANAIFFTVSLTDEENEAVQETPFLIESAQDNLSLEQEEWLESLRSANFWSKDLFLELYGSRDPGGAGETFKIAIGSGAGRHIIQAGQGGYLVFQNGCWAPAPLDAAADKPLAQVLGLNAQGLWVRVWDVSGFMSAVISLSSAPPAPISSKIEADFLSPRLRNSAEVTCLLGQRRIVLKPGDWWIKRENRRWQCLKRINEIDDFLAFKSEGEIFVVDTLEKHQGRSMLKGRLFDKTRQFTQIVSLPVAEGRTGSAVKNHKDKDIRKKAVHESARRAPVPLARREEEKKP